MDSNQVLDIPDTPDRLTVRHVNHVSSGKETTSSKSPHPRKSNVTDEVSSHQQRASRSRAVCENGYNRRLHFHPSPNPITIDEIFEPQKKCITGSSENSHPSHRAPLFRRAGSVVLKPETRHSGGPHFDRRKNGHPKNPLKASAGIENDAFVDLTEQVDHEKILEMAFPRGASKDLCNKGVKEDQGPSTGGSSLNISPVPSRISSIALKGKEKVDVTSDGSGSSINQVKGMVPSGDSQCRTETHLAVPHVSFGSPRVAGRKRLVRNGCISPCNIVDRDRNEAEKLQVGSADVERNHIMKMVQDGPSQVDISEVVAEDNNRCRAKGKGTIMHSYKSKVHDANINHVASSSSEVAFGNGCAHRNESVGCWRNTHSRGKEMDRSVSRHDGRCFINEEPGNRMLNRINTSANQQCPVGARLYKRRKTEESTSRNHGRRSVIVLDDSETSGLLRESFSSSPSSVQNHQNNVHLGPIDVIDELPSDMRNSNSNVQETTPACNEESDARTRQVEADEILARELQEQLYHEMPSFSGEEVDEHIAWALQQEEGAVPSASSHNRPVPRTRGSSIRTRGRAQFRYSHPSNRRGTQVPASTTRAPRSRSRIINRHPILIPRYRNHARGARGLDFQFPLGMDLDTRLDFLEELENAFSGSRTLQVQHDFNENDYEMLLALDENNVQSGASANQISNLPESVVQTDNFEEPCAVCLEMPTRGETIRHLPCLHKFHKECIDPWLSRKTSCPVCKSSIT